MFEFNEERFRYWIRDLLDAQQVLLSWYHLDCIVQSLREWCNRWLR